MRGRLRITPGEVVILSGWVLMLSRFAAEGGLSRRRKRRQHDRLGRILPGLAELHRHHQGTAGQHQAGAVLVAASSGRPVKPAGWVSPGAMTNRLLLRVVVKLATWGFARGPGGICALIRVIEWGRCPVRAHGDDASRLICVRCHERASQEPETAGGSGVDSDRPGFRSALARRSALLRA